MGIGDEAVESGPLEDLLRLYRLTPRDMAARARALIAAREGRVPAAGGGAR
jgi:hypothetical protein